MRKRKRRLCKEDPNCEYVGKTDWRKGFCTRHAKAQGFQDPNPKRSHQAKKLKVKDVLRKPKLKLKVKPKLKLKKAEAARVAARAAMESDSEPDVFPFPPRAEDAELLCQMHDEDLAKLQSDPDADIFQYPLRAQDKQMLSKLIFLDSKTKAKAKKKEKPRSQVLRSTFEKESQAALKLINSKKLQKRQKKEQKLKRKDIEAMHIEFKPMEPLAAVEAELAESDAEFRSWSDEPQRRSSEEAAVRSREDKEILGLRREAAVRRREDEISVHKATLRRARLGTARNRLDFDDVDFCWPSPPRGRLVWDED